jgi:hypothetical protein
MENVFRIDPVFDAVHDAVVSHKGLSCTVTIISDGMIIEGDICHERDYFEEKYRELRKMDKYELSRKAASLTSYSQSNNIETSLAKLELKLTDLYQNSSADGEYKSEYLTLKKFNINEVNYKSGSNENLFWRGKFSAITSVIKIGPIRAEL